MKRIVLLLIFAVILSGCGANSTQKATKDNPRTIKVALSAEVNPPYFYTDEHNQYKGLDMEYMKMLEEKLPQYRFKYELGEEESNLVGLGSKKYDMAINWFFKTKEREQKFLYQDVPYSYALPMLAVHESNQDIHQLSDLHDKRLTPMSPSGGLYSILMSHNATHDKKIKIDTLQSPSNGNNLQMIEDKRRDAMLINWNTYSAVQKAIHTKTKIGGIVKKEPLHIVYHKDEQRLHDDIDQATKELHQEGKLQKLSQKYMNIDVFEDIETLNAKKDKLEEKAQ
ncbi:transporter substrate-binding domain-containing protein [Staphylococcus massiliensis]|uniref:Amino acid ABC transporter substrate-binding protein n=1 Tax=Staphylococcus massiliensis S46 TaxID=1229783 RepID=K9B5D9_9STAP|nr:transporter substrate-binding domain-containing protein [Staphylococcus massiliensis]EKU48965.1 amino acid ABC transporter substrate-binding protein [Staphylococcus massiliensis S46]MCG3399405.1 transporter substrate-binding domain-containing protein [Staphylococcus massiliensis]MCG3402494.1 transporter substrate-binding domain-containing protein [Staphylococcus massiliensis]MCG3411541.1 transporter substrate-binding domain-containing protein [Staphylococcus massiliensis]PNZ98753.1 amino ac